MSGRLKETIVKTDPSKRIIMHIDADAFFASVEQGGIFIRFLCSHKLQ